MRGEIFFPADGYQPQSFHIDGACIFFVGHLHHTDREPLHAMCNALLYKGKLIAKDHMSGTLRDLRGNFAFAIQDSEGKILACVDKIRSYPLFYHTMGENFVVSTDAHMIKDMIGDLSKKSPAVLEFKMAGYVSGRDTLLESIYKLQAGEFLYFDGARLHVEDYYLFYSSQSLDLSREELIEKLHEATKSIFKKLIERLDGRPVLLSLSGGLDSRLILCMLKFLGYENIKTFTYGLPGNHEARRARQVAQRIGVDWFFVSYTRHSGKNMFSSAQYEAYSQFAHRLSTTPFLADFQALSYLKRSKALPSDTVMLNGLSGDFITGGHIPRIFDHQETISNGVFIQAIIQKHYSLWQHLYAKENIAAIKKRIQEILPFEIKSNMDREYAMKLYEIWDWRARQTSFVVNAERAYDFFGFSWDLPLWDDEYLNFWSQVPFQYKFRQRLYEDYLSTFDFFGVFRNVRREVYLSPSYTRWLQRLLCRFGANGREAARIFLSYWQNDAHYYALYPYWEYLRHARVHKSSISYHVKHLLEHEYGEAVF